MTQATMAPKRESLGLQEAFIGLVAAMGATIIFVPWLSGETPYQLFFDDFYYYLIVADAWVFDGEMSFFPGVKTNGFHPLWFFLIASLRWLFGQNDTLLFATLSGIMWASQLVVIWLAWKLAKRTGVRPACVAIAIFAAGAQFVQISSYGMEVTLVTPLLMALLLRMIETPLENQTPRALLLTGFIAALTCLSRLDAAIFVLFMGLPSLPALLKSPRCMGLLLVGGAILPAYFVWNIVEFSALMPASGAAKQLKGDVLPSILPMQLLFQIAPESRPFGLAALVMVVVRLLVQRPGGTEAAYLAGVLGFFLVHSSLSDWMLWFWYLYPIVPAIALSGPPVLESIGRVGRVLVTAAFILVLIPFVIVHIRSGPVFMPLLQPLAKEVADLTKARPGVYSMGDRAGMAAYFSHVPILQTEGLVMDRAYLENIRQEKDLIEVLQAYGVRYYLTFEPKREGSCWVVEEPARAGPDSPKMRGRFCQDPIEKRKFNKREFLYVFEVPSP